MCLQATPVPATIYPLWTHCPCERVALLLEWIWHRVRCLTSNGHLRWLCEYRPRLKCGVQLGWVDRLQMHIPHTCTLRELRCLGSAASCPGPSRIARETFVYSFRQHLQTSFSMVPSVTVMIPQPVHILVPPRALPNPARKWSHSFLDFQQLLLCQSVVTLSLRHRSRVCGAIGRIRGRHGG
jgi:hypothetical protein